MTEVSQEARRNAQALLKKIDCMGGESDEAEVVQAFAKFEQSIRQSAERGEVVAWMYEKNGKVLLDHGPTCSDDMVSGGWAASPLYTPPPPEAA